MLDHLDIIFTFLRQIRVMSFPGNRRQNRMRRMPMYAVDAIAMHGIAVPNMRQHIYVSINVTCVLRQIPNAYGAIRATTDAKPVGRVKINPLIRLLDFLVPRQYSRQPLGN